MSKLIKKARQIKRLKKITYNDKEAYQYIIDVENELHDYIAVYRVLLLAWPDIFSYFAPENVIKQKTYDNYTILNKSKLKQQYKSVYG
ncbi:MAG: hypothetical protein A2Y66_01880 [Nitrospirae bacterium RBG_13_41_22]|nr:MAG: hypothetical protein A2Y66_01880 [Nitrospirae bacterium RBG_13_41_22]